MTSVVVQPVTNRLTLEGTHTSIKVEQTLTSVKARTADIYTDYYWLYSGQVLAQHQEVDR